MENQETLIIKKFCRGDRKSLFNIHPMGIDFEMPIGRFLLVFQSLIAQNGFEYVVKNSDENNKVYINVETKAIFLVIINSEKRITEINWISQSDNLSNQIWVLEKTMSQFVDLYGAPHEWVKLNDDITACSWGAINGNSFSIIFNRATNEIVCKHLRSE
jgi:hypothetical protein